VTSHYGGFDHDEGSDSDYSALDALLAHSPSAGNIDAAEVEPHRGKTSPDQSDQQQIPTLFFTATNPQDTVSATTLLSGQVHSVELSPRVVTMSEGELAQEILMISALASRQALAGAHALTAAVLRRLGHDAAATRSILEREHHLPSPDTVRSERAALFAERYAEEVD
jgi:hypothetical protein